MNRTPQVDVRRELRREVGFGCPIPGCGIPYLTWHHFDPPWREEQHHRPEGMIALCLTHAGQADANAFESEYLKDLKHSETDREEVRGELTWMRKKVLALVGGNWYYETPVILKIGATDAISFSRDDEGYLLLSLRMPTLSGLPRAQIVENFFTVGRDQVSDIECAARGRTIKIEYSNGDRFLQEYRDMADEDSLRSRYGDLVGSGPVNESIEFPLTVVEVSEQTKDSRLDFDPLSTRIGGMQMSGCWSIRNGVGVHFDVPPDVEKRFFPVN
jgi:hypothetical protein